jgi:thioredoxin-related protein
MWMLIFSLLGLVQPVVDLQQTAIQARQNERPILLYVSRSDCTFCRRFEADVLGPLIRSDTIAELIVVRELVSDLPGTVIDFFGRSVTRKSIARTYQAELTPTLLFVDAQGREVVPRITGYRESDYFSYYLESAIAQAASAIKQGKAIKHDNEKALQ